MLLVYVYVRIIQKKSLRFWGKKSSMSGYVNVTVREPVPRDVLLHGLGLQREHVTTQQRSIVARQHFSIDTATVQLYIHI